MKKEQIARIGLIALTVFCLLIAGNAIYKKYWVEQNISERVNNISGVISSQIVEKKDKRELQVVVEKIENLVETCEKLNELSYELPVRFVDQRSDELNDFYRQIQYALQEALVRGNFTEMIQTITEKAEPLNIEVTVDIDKQYIYLVLNKGEAQLISVLDRQDQIKYLPSIGKGETL